MQGAFHGGDYPNDSTLTLHDNETATISKWQGHYKSMYIDAFIATAQCAQFSALPDHLKAPNADNYIKEKQELNYGVDKDPVESLI